MNVKKIFSIVLLGAMLVGFVSCDEEPEVNNNQTTGQTGSSGSGTGGGNTGGSGGGSGSGSGSGSENGTGGEDENGGGGETTTPTFENQTLTVEGVSFTMVAVEGGTFTMGATSEQGSDADSDENPTHEVTLSNYYIGETEVTQGLWEAVMGYTPTESGSQWSSTYGLGDDYPAYYISWNDCQEFITKLNELTGKTFRMPTEAEWEYAARGGKESQGYKYSGSNTIDDVAWYWENCDGSNGNPYGSQQVGTKQANELGIYDMSGNVYEWCSDWFGDYSSSARTNPSGPESGSYRVGRGGYWSSNARGCRVSYRNYGNPDSRYNYIGLRLVLFP